MHTNTDVCNGCEAILRAYPNSSPTLLEWVKNARVIEPQMHVSVAGRGRAKQEIAYQAGLTKAVFGKSPHNYNLAVDVFRLVDGKADFNVDWYKTVVGKLVAINPNLEWSGDWHDFHEFDHVEIKHWQYLVSQYPERYPLISDERNARKP